MDRCKGVNNQQQHETAIACERIGIILRKERENGDRNTYYNFLMKGSLSGGAKECALPVQFKPQNRLVWKTYKLIIECFHLLISPSISLGRSELSLFNLMAFVLQYSYGL